jgi:hypothetical protein
VVAFMPPLAGRRDKSRAARQSLHHNVGADRRADLRTRRALSGTGPSKPRRAPLPAEP